MVHIGHMDSRTDEELLQAYYGCEDTALESLCERYYRRLWDYFRKLGFSEQDAEELTQETFLKVATGKRRDRGRFCSGNFQGWLFTVAHNVAFDHWRRMKRLREVPLESDKDSGETPLTVCLTDDWAKPDEVAETVLFAQVLTRCLAKLTFRNRAIFLLKDYFGYSGIEVGGMLGMTEAQVNMARFHTRRKIQECLEEKGISLRPLAAPGPITQIIMKFKDEILVYLEKSHRGDIDE